MKSRQRNIVFALMTLALTGLIAFQIYWINNALDLSEQQFTRNVQETLVQVADRLEKQEARQITANSFFYISRDEPVAIQSGKIRGMSSAHSSSQPYVLKSDTIIFRASGNQKYNVLEERKIKNKVELVDIAVHRIMDKSKESIITRINQPHLDSILSATLREKGIQIQYEYGVIQDNRGIDSVIMSNPNAIPTKVMQSEFKASLFPNDLDGPSHLLAVYFPHQSTYILNQIGTTLIASIVFIAVILGCFIYTIRIIGKQKKLSQIKTDFINNMTHEFKTPIATISLATQVLSEVGVAENKQSRQKYLHVIKDENERLSQQVERVLQSALMDNNELYLSKERESLHVIIEKVLDTFSVINTNVILVNQLEAENDTVFVDVHHFQNVLTNLLDNALKYSPSGCKITIKTKNEQSDLLLSIKDEGRGMDPKQVKFIFDSFYRIPTGNLHDVKGFGLGLSYVRRILELHDGSIDVKSKLGQGSEFILKIRNVK